MRRIWRLGVIAAAAAVAFAVAIGRFSVEADRGCVQRVKADPTYRVRLQEEPRMDLTRYHLAVSRDGRPVTGAAVCVNAYMQNMSAMAVTDVGREVRPGSYEVSLTFEMGGRWGGRVLIIQPGRAAVAVPMDLRVARRPATVTQAPPTGSALPRSDSPEVPDRRRRSSE